MAMDVESFEDEPDESMQKEYDNSAKKSADLEYE